MKSLVFKIKLKVVLLKQMNKGEKNVKGIDIKQGTL
jgi:hypothetical protein